MRWSHWGAIACTAIASFASDDSSAQAQPCNGGVCKAVVSVTASGGACAVTGVVPEPLRVTGGPNNIEWDFDDATPGDVRFTDQGITFADPGNQFSEPVIQAGGRKFRWHDRNDASPAPFKYTISARIGGVMCTPLDPTIVNQG